MRSNLKTPATCLKIILATGALLIMIGTAIIPFQPCIQLDAVLSPAELAVPEKAVALQLLKDAAGKTWSIHVEFAK